MIFSIKKGSHYSNNFLYKLLTFINIDNKMSYYVTFNETNIYNDKTIDKYDVNKLFGFSQGMHHKNSHRFGWNCLNNRVRIYSYSYINGVRIINDIGSININEKYKFSITINGDKCVFTIIDSNYKIKQILISSPSKKVLGYKLWPYFGGNNAAPKEIELELNKIKK